MVSFGQYRASIKTYWDIGVSVITIVGAIVAGGWALHEYNVRQQGDRVTRTLAYQQDFNKDAVFQARREIANVWLENEAKEEQLIADKKFKEFPSFVLGVIAENHLDGDIEVVTDFFEQLNACLRRQLCDNETALDLFGPIAEQINNQHFDYFTAVRKRRQDDTFARGLDDIALAAKAARRAHQPLSP